MHRVRMVSRRILQTDVLAPIVVRACMRVSIMFVFFICVLLCR